MKIFALITLLTILNINPAISRHHTKTQVELSKSAEIYKKATRAYKSGDYGTTLIHLKPLAKQNYKKAQSTLGWMYETGKGLQRDYIMAYVWYYLAVENGHKKAHRNLNVIKSKLDAKSLVKARALLQECLTSPSSCPKYSD